MAHDNEHIHQNPEAFFAAVEKARTAFAHIPGFVGVGYGLRMKNGIPTDELTIHIDVVSKKAHGEVPAGELIPAEFEGYAIDVNQAEVMVNYGAPLKGGAQISLAKKGTVSGALQASNFGTLGCIVRKRGSSDRLNVYLLTCQHVLAASKHTVNDIVYSPTPTGQALGPIVAPLVRENVEFNGTEYYIDAGIARIDIDSECCCCTCTKDAVKYAPGVITNMIWTAPDKFSDGEIVDVRNAIGDPELIGRPVYKVGAKTGRIAGRVLNVKDVKIVQEDGTSPICKNVIGIIFDTFAPENGGGKRNSEGRFAFAEQGDSGSIVFDANRKVIGLLIAGPGKSIPDAVPTALFSYASFIVPVLDKLNICIPTTTGASHGACLATDGSGIPGGTVSASGATIEMEAKTAIRPFPEFIGDEITRLENIRDQFDTLPLAKKIHDAVDQFKREIAYLVSASRPVMVTWQRNKGPAFLAAFVQHLRGESAEIKTQIGEHSLVSLLQKMNIALRENGSNQLRETLDELAPLILQMAAEGRSTDEYLHFLKKQSHE